MEATTHLRSLQALELAIRLGSHRAAAEHLGITSAAVGQRIRALEDYLGIDLVMRGRSGLQPTPELAHALGDLRVAFAALERASQALDFQRAREIQIVADPDWAELWLAPRLQAFRQDHPNLLFCINGTGDVPLRLGAPDIRVDCEEGPGDTLYTDICLPVTGPDNVRRIAGASAETQMEGMPLLHLKSNFAEGGPPGWVEWFRQFGHRSSGQDRGVHYQTARLALEAVRQNVGFLVCGWSLVQQDIAEGSVVTPFPLTQHLANARTYRLHVRPDLARRPYVHEFVSWLRSESSQTQQSIAQVVAGV